MFCDMFKFDVYEVLRDLGVEKDVFLQNFIYYIESSVTSRVSSLLKENEIVLACVTCNDSNEVVIHVATSNDDNEIRDKFQSYMEEVISPMDLGCCYEYVRIENNNDIIVDLEAVTSIQTQRYKDNKRIDRDVQIMVDKHKLLVHQEAFWL